MTKTERSILNAVLHSMYASNLVLLDEGPITFRKMCGDGYARSHTATINGRTVHVYRWGMGWNEPDKNLGIMTAMEFTQWVRTLP